MFHLLSSRSRGEWFRTASRFVYCTLCFSLLSGCASLGTAPLQALTYSHDATTRQPHLLVMMRGFGEDHHVFEREGVIDEIRKRDLPFDVVVPNTHFGYYQGRTLVQRLKADIIGPARAQGYEHVWLAGFSMGGLGALLYLRDQPGDIDGVLLTSPFLGYDSIHQDIRLAGGPAKWHAQAMEASREASPDVGVDAWQADIWGWIAEQKFGAMQPVRMAYGERDFIVGDGPALLASVLPEQHVIRSAGTHSIASMKALFMRQLDQLAALYPATPPLAEADTRIRSAAKVALQER